MKRLFWIFICIAPLAAQSPSREPSELIVHGEATVSVTPDLVELDIGVITQKATSDEAAGENANRSTELVEQLHKLVPSAAIKTVNLSVNPNYRYPQDGGTPKILGYTATNTVRLDLQDLSLLRKAIEIATKSGANNINRLTFALRNENAARGSALSNAAEQARSGADALASTLKMKLGRLIRVEEVQPVIISPAREIELSSLKEAAPGASLEPGTIQIHASVNLTFEIVSQSR